MSKLIRLKYVSTEGLASLKANFNDNLEHYLNNNQEYFQQFLDQNGYLLDSAYTVEDFRDELIYDEDTDKSDFCNIKVVYKALQHIPSFIMMDDRFWAGLTHTIMWEYIQIRRKDIFVPYNESDKEKVFGSFFTHTKNGKKRGTYVNCVSRLWWAGRLTYDESNHNDPFNLTEELCKTGFPSTIVLISSSNILSKKQTMVALLKTIKGLRAQGKAIKRQDIVAGIRYLNLSAGITLLDMMSIQEIEGMLQGFYSKYLTSHRY